DRLRAAVRGRHVLRHVAHVVVERGRAFIRELACRHGRERVVTLGRKQGLEIAGRHFSHFATIAALSADPRESVLESHREDRGLSGARKRSSGADAGGRKRAASKRWSAHIFGEYAFLEDSCYASQAKNARGKNSHTVARVSGGELRASV